MANQREELLDESLELLSEKKVASGAMKDISKRVLKITGAEKEDWNLLKKVYAKMGKGWIDENKPLTLQEDAEKKDTISVLFLKLLKIINVFESFQLTDSLIPYIEALKAFGIELKIDSSKFEHAEVSTIDIEDELRSSKHYIETIDQYNDVLKKEHAPKSEELNFTVASDYGKVLSLYSRKLKGKDIDDAVQDILTRNELLDTAVNLIQDLNVDAE